MPLRTLQEWMGHRDLQTTQIYADYAPSSREADMVAGAFARQGPVRGPILSEPDSTPQQPNPGERAGYEPA